MEGIYNTWYLRRQQKMLIPFFSFCFHFLSMLTPSSLIYGLNPYDKVCEEISFLVGGEVQLNGSPPLECKETPNDRLIHFILPSLYIETTILSKGRIRRQVCVQERFSEPQSQEGNEKVKANMAPVGISDEIWEMQVGNHKHSCKIL